MDLYASLPISQLAAVGKGAFTEIVDIVAPSSAPAGSRVDITVKIKNLYSSTIGIMVGGALEYGVSPWPTITFPSPSANVGPGATYSFNGYFTMPSVAVTIHAYSYYYAEGSWYFDDERTKNVTVAVVYQGTISRKELEYNESRAAIPASNIPKDKRGLVHIWGRNDMTTTQQMGIWWEVKDPGGIIRETYAKWETFWTGPGNAQEFIGGRFNLDKTGTWTIAVQLFMNPADQVVVDDYYGTLCTVAAVVPEPEFAGFGVTDYSKI